MFCCTLCHYIIYIRPFDMFPASRTLKIAEQWNQSHFYLLLLLLVYQVA